jgi:transposase
MEQLVSASLPPHGSFGAFLRARRHRALLSQEQLAARAELSERTVRDLETGRVRSPRPDTARLLADALQLTGPERENWFAAARKVNHQRAGPGAGGPAPPPGDPPAQLPLSACGFGMRNKPRRRRSFAGEFTVEIVELCRHEDHPAGQVARDVDLIETADQAWVKQPEPDAATGNDGGLTTAERRELAELRRENRRLREDFEILKRATAILTTATR